MNDLIFYQVESSGHTVDDLVDSFYPEFAFDNKKRTAIKAAIIAMNKHLGISDFGSLSFLSWVVMPDYGSSVCRRIADRANPDALDSAWEAQNLVSDVPDISGNTDIQYAMEQYGPAKIFAISDFYFDWLNEFKANLAESPLKDSVTESTSYFIEKAGEHGYEVFIATRSLDTALKKFASASGKEARQLAKSEVLIAHKNLEHELPKAVKSLVNHYSHKTSMRPSSFRGFRAINSAGNALRSADKLSKSNSFVISSSKYTKMVKVMKYGRYVGKGLIALDVITNSVDVTHAYEKGENWKELAFEDFGAIAGSLVGGGLGGIESIASGPGAIFTAPILSISGAIIGEKSGKSLGKLVYKAIYE